MVMEIWKVVLISSDEIFSCRNDVFELLLLKKGKEIDSINATI